MTRILVQRGSGSSSTSQNRASSSTVPPSPAPKASSTSKDEEQENELMKSCVDIEEGAASINDVSTERSQENKNDVKIIEQDDNKKAFIEESVESAVRDRVSDVVHLSENLAVDESVTMGVVPPQIVVGSNPPAPPIPPPKPSSPNTTSRRPGSGFSNAVTSGSRRQAVRPVMSTWPPPSGSLPSSPRSYADSEGYNSADEQAPCFISSPYNDMERERLFEFDIRRVKGFEVKKMMEDGNCLFRAVADQVYGDPEAYDLARQMCIDYMERERDHFSQFITEGFTTYCKRKRRDKVYGNNLEIQAFSEMYNRPIHIYCYSTEPINIFHGTYGTDTPPIRLSFHHGNHYNSLVDPRRLTIGAGLGFSSLRKANIDKEQVKAAIKAQQDQQIDNALLSEGRFYSDMELTEKEIERMVMEASRAEYFGEDKLRQQQLTSLGTSTSTAEPSSSGSRDVLKKEKAPVEVGPSGSVQLVLSMGFSYVHVIEAYSIFGDDVDSMVCYLLEMGSGVASFSAGSDDRQKGKAAE